MDSENQNELRPVYYDENFLPSNKTFLKYIHTLNVSSINSVVESYFKFKILENNRIYLKRTSSYITSKLFIYLKQLLLIKYNTYLYLTLHNCITLTHGGITLMYNILSCNLTG